MVAPAVGADVDVTTVGGLRVSGVTSAASKLSTVCAITTRSPVERWATTQFVDRALADLGVYPGLDDPGRPIPAAARP